MIKSPKIRALLATGLFAIPAHAAFVLSLEPIPVVLTPDSLTGSVNIVATNTGPTADDLVFFTVSFAYLSGSTDITIDSPATISHFGSPFVGGAGLGPGDQTIIGVFSFTMSGAVSPTVASPITTDFGGILFSQALSSPAVVSTPLTATVVGIPEPSSALLVLSAAGFAFVRRRGI